MLKEQSFEAFYEALGRPAEFRVILELAYKSGWNECELAWWKDQENNQDWVDAQLKLNEYGELF